MHATVNIPASEVHGLQLRPPRSIEVTKIPLFPENSHKRRLCSAIRPQKGYYVHHMGV